MVYRQLGESNSQWHNKKFKKVPVGGSASWGKCQLGEVLVGGSASWGKCQLGKCQLGDECQFGTKIKPLDGRIFSNFVGGKN